MSLSLQFDLFAPLQSKHPTVAWILNECTRWTEEWTNMIDSERINRCMVLCLIWEDLHSFFIIHYEAKWRKNINAPTTNDMWVSLMVDVGVLHQTEWLVAVQPLGIVYIVLLFAGCHTHKSTTIAYFSLTTLWRLRQRWCRCIAFTGKVHSLGNNWIIQVIEMRR